MHIPAFSAFVCLRIRALCSPLDAQPISGCDTDSRLHEGEVLACTLARGRGDCGVFPIPTGQSQLAVDILQVSRLCWSDTWIVQMP